MSPEPSGNDPTARIPRRGPSPVSGISPSEIQDAYLKRAIAEIENLNREILECPRCRQTDDLPVLASGSPQAEIMLIKWSASLAERQEGIAFFGRAGTAVLKSVQRLGVDPVTIYGTLAAKCDHDADLEPQALDGAWLSSEIAIILPKIVVVMGERALAAVNALDYPMADPLSADVGVVQKWTPTIEALYVPDIDESLDEQNAKRAFWAAFRALGDWHEAQPPY